MEKRFHSILLQVFTKKWTNIAESLNLPFGGSRWKHHKRVPQTEQRFFIFTRPALQGNIDKAKVTILPESINAKTPARQKTEVTHFHTSVADAPCRQAPNSRQGRTNVPGSSRHTEIVAWGSTHPRRGTSSTTFKCSRRLMVTLTNTA